MGEKITFRCGPCGTINRSPVERAGQTARCGQCGAELTVPRARGPVNVTDLDFDTAVRGSKEPVIVEFWSPSCGHCIRMEPVVEEVARELSGRAKVAKLDVSANPRSAAMFEIRGTPAFVLVKDGREVARVVGARPKDELLRSFSSYI